MERKYSIRFTLLILVLSILVITIESCSKDDDSAKSEYYVRFNANGQKIEFRIHGSLTAAFGQSGSQYNAVFTGYDELSNISLQVFDNKAIAPATFTGYTFTGSSFTGALIGYQDKAGTLYTQGATNSNASITISEITSSTVRGTFNGTLKATGKSDVSVTNGEFFVWRAN